MKDSFVLLILFFLLFIENNSKDGINGVSKWIDPYDKGKPTYKKRNKPGVYLIRSKSTNKIVYVGFSKNNMYRTMYRHFQQWQGQHITYNPNNFEVRIIETTSARAEKLEKYLIHKYKPVDNSFKYDDVDDKNMVEVWRDINEEDAPF